MNFLCGVVYTCVVKLDLPFITQQSLEASALLSSSSSRSSPALVVFHSCVPDPPVQRLANLVSEDQRPPSLCVLLLVLAWFEEGEESVTALVEPFVILLILIAIVGQLTCLLLKHSPVEQTRSE